MFATAALHKLPFMGALQELRTVHFGLGFNRERARAVQREERDLACVPWHALDDLGLLSGEGCVSDWGLVEASGRLRSGWS